MDKRVKTIRISIGGFIKYLFIGAAIVMVFAAYGIIKPCYEPNTGSTTIGVILAHIAGIFFIVCGIAGLLPFIRPYVYIELTTKDLSYITYDCSMKKQIKVSIPVLDIQTAMLDNIKHLRNYAQKQGDEFLQKQVDKISTQIKNTDVRMTPTSLPLKFAFPVAAEFIPLIYVKGSHDNSFIINTKLFSRAGIRRLFEELKNRGITVIDSSTN